MLQTIADDEIVDMQEHVVDRDLVENLLGDLDMRRLILNDHSWSEVAMVEHAVGTQRFVAHGELYLVCH